MITVLKRFMHIQDPKWKLFTKIHKIPYSEK